MPKINSDLFRTMVLTILAGLAVLIMTVSNRNVYSKEIVDTKLEVVDTKIESVNEKIGNVEEDVQWIVRRMGGTPSVDTAEGDHSP